MLSILRKARLKDKEMRVLMLWGLSTFNSLIRATDDLAAASTMRAKPPLSKGSWVKMSIQ